MTSSPKRLLVGAIACLTLLGCDNGVTADPVTARVKSLTTLGKGLLYQGANLTGAERGFGSELQESWGVAIPGTEGSTYFWPNPDTSSADKCVDTLIPYGLVTYRLPFQWERLQPTLKGPLDSAYLAKLHTTVEALRTRGAHIVLDIHNYAYYKVNGRGTSSPGQLIGSSDVPIDALADVWTKLAKEFGSSSTSSPIIFGLMNEPHDLTVRTWVDAAQLAVTAIRDAGAKNPIFVPGADWSTAKDFSWSQNKDLLQSVTDPLDNMAIEVHQYADDCDTNPNAHVEKLAVFEAWAQANHRYAFLGETDMKKDTSNCQAEFRSFLKHMTDLGADKPNGVWIGWAYWTIGGDSTALDNPGYAVDAIRTNLPTTCGDGSKSGAESDVDCGGTCRRCADGKACTADYECQGGFCVGANCSSSGASGGTGGSGGLTGNGGATSNGGGGGSGGMTGGGGAIPATGGTSGSGGASARGGSSGSGGMTGGGGSTGSGGSPNGGGTSGSGGSATSGSGGTKSSTGGSLGTGGSASTGGSLGTGGSGSGGSGSGGRAGSGGASGQGGNSSPSNSTTPSGCGCRIDDSSSKPTGRTPLLVLGILVALVLRRRPER